MIDLNNLMIKDSLKGFKQFILRGNVVDLAVGIVIGAGFSGIVNSFVKDFVTPLVGIFFNSADFANFTFSIHGSKFSPGDFINNLISFVIIAIVVFFFVVTPMNLLVSRMQDAPPADPATKKCPQCLGEVPTKATRCCYCTQVIV
jgi:large conductance mechanosensitive channel